VFALGWSAAPDRRAEALRHDPSHSQGRLLRLLFIGNSLTSANDLPGMVEALSRTSRGPRIDCESIGPIRKAQVCLARAGST